jgi:hypothetical protein
MLVRAMALDLRDVETNEPRPVTAFWHQAGADFVGTLIRLIRMSR